MEIDKPMSPERVKQTLNLIRQTYKRILDPSLDFVIPSAIEMVEATRRLYDDTTVPPPPDGTPKRWGYTISEKSPLRFQRSETRGIGYTVDIFCDVKWEDGILPVKQDIVVRVWSDHDETIFDPDRDAEFVFNRLSDQSRWPQGRVVTRLHFDRVNYTHTGAMTEYHPEHHLQFGGIGAADELCLFPKSVDVPRLACQPMELFLTCQFVVANFFWQDYVELRNRREWSEELASLQFAMWRAYYKRCMDTITDRKSLLDALPVLLS